MGLRALLTPLENHPHPMKTSLGSLAAIACLAAPALHADPLLSAISNQPFANDSDLALDIDGNGSTDFYLFANFAYAELYSAQPGINFVTNTTYNFGDSITPAAPNSYVTGLDLGTTAYYGLSFDRGSATQLGWILIAMDPDYPWAGTILSAGWETTPATAISAGSPAAVPEPADTALGFGLFAGLAFAFRRRFARWFGRK